MNLFRCSTQLIKALIILYLFILLIAIPLIPTCWAEKKPWTGQLGNLSPITEKELNDIINRHIIWLSTPGEGERADFSEAVLKDSSFWKANLKSANFRGANLSGAMITEGDMSDTDLWGATLTGAVLSKVNLKGANLHSAKIRDVVFELKRGALPDLDGITKTDDPLLYLTYKESANSLIELRNELHNNGFHSKAREVTYAIKHSERLHLWNQIDGTWLNRIFGKIESLFLYVMFELTCMYGYSPGRPLEILVCLMIVFSLPYMIALNMKKDRNGIWMVWAADRIYTASGSKKPVLLFAQGHKIIYWGLYFSLLSAFHMGWRELNVGHWIARIQRNEYTLRATGIVRTISGIQSLLSVYLLALWVLSYFGRPFE